MRKSLILLGILDDSDVDWFIRVSTKRNIRQGQTLIQEGKPIESLFILLSGACEVFVGKDRTPIARLLTGEILGEMSFVDSRPPSASVVAEQDSWVLDIPRTEVSMRLIDEIAFGARFYRAIAVFLSNRLRDTVSHLGYGTAFQLDESIEDGDEIPEDLLEKMSIAGIRLSMLQNRARSASSA